MFDVYTFICVCSCKRYHVVLRASAFNLPRCYCAIGLILFLFFSLNSLFLICIHFAKYASNLLLLLDAFTTFYIFTNPVVGT